jgi:5-methylcytosine-specific restriction protein A
MNRAPIAKRSPDGAAVAASPREVWHGWYSLAIWARVKAGFRSKFPERAVICQAKDDDGTQCRKPASEIDHIRPHRGDWFLFLGGVNYENLQGLCHEHHSQKTAAEDGGFGNDQ